MFGYMEHHHTVVSSCTIVRGGKEVQLDVRRPMMQVPPANEDGRPFPKAYQKELDRQTAYYSQLPDYLVLTCNGNSIYMEYNGPDGKEKAMASLAQDHARLMAEPDVAFKQLQWEEYIKDDTGYGRNGSVTMY